MEPRDYTVVAIEGEYAYLKEDGTNNEPLFIALALLPEGTDIGTRLHYEWMSYSIAD